MEDNSLKHIGSIQKFESIQHDRFLNLNVITKSIPEKNDEELKLNMRNLPDFDRILLSKIIEKELINKKNVKQSIYDIASAHKPFFNVQSQSGSALFVPIERRRNSPNA
jgi:hypothetical protein